MTTLLSDYHHTIQVLPQLCCSTIAFSLWCRWKRMPGRQWMISWARAEIWARVDKAWAAIHSITERKLGPHVVRRLNAQRYAHQVLRAKEFIAFCGSKRNNTEPARQRLIEFYAKNSWSTQEDLNNVFFDRQQLPEWRFASVKQLLHCMQRIISYTAQKIYQQLNS